MKYMIMYSIINLLIKQIYFNRRENARHKWNTIRLISFYLQKAIPMGKLQIIFTIPIYGIGKFKY